MATASVPNSFTNGTAADASLVNANFAALVNFANNSVIQRDGSKAMTAAFDAGSQKVVNLATGTNANDGVNKAQLDAAIAAIPAPSLGVVEYVSATANQDVTTTETVTLTLTWTAVSGRLYKITYVDHFDFGISATPQVDMAIRLTNASGTLVALKRCENYGAIQTNMLETFVTGSGSVTYVGTVDGTNTSMSAKRSSGRRAYMVVEDIGEA